MRPTELHHRISDSRVNRIKYPLLIHSMLNLVAVSHAGHMAIRSYRSISFFNAVRMENFLGRHPAICAWVNNPEKSFQKHLMEVKKNWNEGKIVRRENEFMRGLGEMES